MNYRADIQILRGVSVILVVLFHLGFSSIQSGFLGVDVFFVISGFLMAVLYKNSDISGFYLRRAKRLLPAYYATIFFTLVFAYFLTTPNETTQVDTQVKYAISFASNIGFWMQNSYFSNSDFNPLLHLWSLGVEIQFYLIVPLLYWFFRKLKLTFWLALIGSMASCFLIVGISPKTSFFMMPFRLWEFLIGYGVAHFLTNQGNAKLSSYKWLGLLGLVVVFIIPLFSVDGEALNMMQGHPGLFALLVCMATAMVLAFGLPSFIEASLIGRALEKIGKYSYSIYLAHFPVIVLYLSQPFSGTNLEIPTIKDGLIIFILICLASALLYFFFEHKRSKYSIKTYAVVSSVVLIVISIILPKIQNNFYSEQEKLVFSAKSDRSVYRCGKLIRILEPTAISCDLTKDITNPKQVITLVGNSHSDSIKASFTKAAVDANTKLYFMVSNTPLMKGSISAQNVVNDAVNHGTDKLVLHYKSNSISNETIEEVVQLAKKVGINVYFIEPVPEWNEPIPSYMYSRILDKNYPSQTLSKKDYIDYNLEQVNFVKSINSPYLTSLSVVDYFCSPECSYSSKEGKPYYFDRHHLTITGSNLLNDVYLQILND